MFSQSSTMPSHRSLRHDLSSQAIILEPIHEEGIDVLLLFFPGAFTTPQSYFPLIHYVQKEFSFRLWVVILDLGESILTVEMVEDSIDGMIKRVIEHGFIPGELSTSKLFIGGHSLGAWCSRSIAKKRAAGFIQMGSFFPSGQDSLAQYPKPVLTLVGSLDGQVGLAPAASHAGEIYATQADMGDFNTFAVKPVAIIPGMNHSQFSHGVPNKARGDLDADIPLEEARSHVAGLVSSFLTLHVLGHADRMRHSALEKLTRAVKTTHREYRTFWEAMDQQGMQAKSWQLQVATVPDLTEDHITVIKHDYVDNFKYSEPRFDQTMDRIFVQLYLSPFKQYGTYVNNVWIKNVWLKMKSHEAPSIRPLFEKCETATNISAADLNAETFDRALSLVTEASRKKFYERGRKLRFVEDLNIVFASIEDWDASDVTVEKAEDGSEYVDVQSPVVIAPADATVASEFAGLHYMKLLSVAPCMEWILLGSFRE